ncbi:MAG: GxxExxY protein [Phycisphaeraceae bacterium]
MKDTRDPRTHAIIGAAMEVHRQLGPGFLERVYQEALAIELEARGVPALREVALEIYYKDRKLSTDYRADFVCYEAVLVETKAQRSVGDVEAAQIIHYLQATRMNVGLLLNFGTPSLEYRRFVRSTESA